MRKLQIFATGGTIDKIYFDKKSDYEVGDESVGKILQAMNVGFEYAVEQLMKIDSLDMTDDHRKTIYEKTIASESKHVLITHGTDGMIDTAKVLTDIDNKVIVLTGSLQPAIFTKNDAVFNVGCSVAAVQCLPDGVYIVMNGKIFTPNNVRKNLRESRFEYIKE